MGHGMRRKRLEINHLFLLVVPMFLAVVTGSAYGKILIRENFDNVAETAKAGITAGKTGGEKGWTQTDPRTYVENPVFFDYPVSFDNVRRGAISFDIQRKPSAASDVYGTLFTFVGGEGEDSPFFFSIRWSSEYDPGRPMVLFRGERMFYEGMGLWSQEVLLDREVLPGQWIHMDITWDDNAGQYYFYVDGRRQDSASKSYNPINKEILPDPRLGAKKEDEKNGTLSRYRSLPFGNILSKVTNVHMGVHTVQTRPGFGYSTLNNAAVSNFVILVDELPAGLGQAKIYSLTDDSFKVAGISGKLVAGDKVSVELLALPGGTATFDMGQVTGIAMSEVPATTGKPGIPAVDNGTYRGTYAIRPGDYFENGQIVGHFVSSDNVAADNVTSASKWTIDSRSRFALTIDKTDLPADSNSSTRIRVRVFDANENPLSDHRMKVTLATTDEYTGLVGGGSTRSRDIAAAVKEQLGGAEVESLWKGVTDKWGEAEFEYKAGFAAKTVILQVKDMTAGNVGADYITSYKEASIDIALTPPVSKAAARRGLQYIMKVEATRTELTADGRSRSVIRATLLDPNGNPVAGDPVVFSLSSPNGELRVISGTTDASGKAMAEYIAGKKIGIVVVSASARGATGSVSITLLADAPAKIYLKARPATLPADGLSRADLDVKVTDINDNPNKDTKVEFKIAKGGGKLEYPDRATDNFGDTKNRYTAGTTAGIATIEATVRSKVPTTGELDKARNILFVPYTDEGDDIRVEKWLKNKGETVKKGETVLEYTVGRGGAKHALQAPYDCRVDFQYVEYWDSAKTGDTLAQITPVVLSGSSGSTPASPMKLAPRRR